MKKGICLLLATFMIFSTDIENVFAAEVKGEKGYGDEWREEDYEKINYALNYIGYDENDTVYYTDFHETRNEEDNIKYISFIYDDEKAIGQYVKEENDGELDTCFIVNKESEVMNSLVQYYKGSEFEITNEDVVMEVAATDGAKNNGWSTMGKGSAEYVTNFADTGKFLATQLVENKNRTVDGIKYGLCWAACGASISNYYRGTSYDTWGVYNLVSKTVGLSNLYGTPATIRCMFSTLGLKMSELDRRLTYTQALNALNNNSLIMYGVEGLYGKHGVVLCGVFRVDSYYGFIYMDPNVSTGYVLNYNDKNVATSTSGDFYYYNGQLKYTSVYVTYYNFEKKYNVK